MLRHAFIMKLRPGAYAEYKRYHDEIWPELAQEIEAAGCRTMSIFEAGPEFLVLYSEVEDEATWPRIYASEAHQRWTEALKPLFVLGEDGKPELGELNEMFTLGAAARG